MAGVAFYPVFKAWNGASPAASGTVEFFEVGGTSTPKDVYDENGSAITQPITLDANGEKAIFGEGAYYMRLKDSSGNTLLLIDNVFFDAWATGQDDLTVTAGSQNVDTISTGLNTDNIDVGGSVTVSDVTVDNVLIQTADNYLSTIYANTGGTAITVGAAPSAGNIKVYNYNSSGTPTATIRWWARVRA